MDSDLNIVADTFAPVWHADWSGTANKIYSYPYTNITLTFDRAYDIATSGGGEIINRTVYYNITWTQNNVAQDLKKALSSKTDEVSCNASLYLYSSSPITFTVTAYDDAGNSQTLQTSKTITLQP